MLCHAFLRFWMATCARPCPHEAAWRDAWLQRQKPRSVTHCSQFGDSSKNLAFTLVLQQALLLARDLAQCVCSASVALCCAVKQYAVPDLRSNNVCMWLPLRSWHYMQTARIYENFDDKPEACWCRWERWGDLAEDEVLGVAATQTCCHGLSNCFVAVNDLGLTVSFGFGKSQERVIAHRCC